MLRPTTRSLAGGAAGIVAGICGGVALTAGSAGNLVVSPVAERIDAAHVPPLLTLPGEPITLRYAIVCRPREDGLPCDGSGVVHARPGQSGPFRAFALERDSDSAEGRYFVTLPRAISESAAGFSYYATLRDDTNGAELTVPSGGAAAPQRSLPLRAAIPVRLGDHPFGRPRAPDARVVDAPWGRGTREAGLAGSRELGFVGPSAFDVEANGTVTLLDQVNRRLQHWSHGLVSLTPVAVSGGPADLEVEPDGTANVLEPPERADPESVLRSFDRDGRLSSAQRLSDRTWAKLAAGPDGPIVLQEPSEQWMPLAASGAALDRTTQAKRARAGKPTGRGREVVVERTGEGELRLADVRGNTVIGAWQVTSATPLGEIQLAEAMGDRLVVVVKVYTDVDGEYVALVLDRSGVVERLSIAADEWAEGAPLARFRLSGGSLYHLGSTPLRAFVDRFDLEEAR
jgi:hypothetical protein